MTTTVLHRCTICERIIWPWQRYGWVVSRTSDGSRRFDYFHRECYVIRRH